MTHSKDDITHRFTNPMASRVTPDLPRSTIIPMESSNRSIQYPNNLPEEEEVEKKALQTIYAELKQAACCRNRLRTIQRWNKIETLFNSLQYKGDKKKIIEKLDDDNNYAPIHYAVRSNNRFVCEKLLYSPEYKCNINLLGWDGQTPLHLAASSSEIEEELKKRPNTREEEDEGDPILFMLLSNRKTRIDIGDDKGRTPLHHAIMRNHITIIKKLLTFNARIDMPDTQGATPIHYAYRFAKKEDMYALFPFKQEYLKLKTVDNKTPFEVAAEYGHLNAIEQYLENFSDEPTAHHNIRSLIHGAIRHFNSEILSRFISNTNMNSYILQIACRQPHGFELFEDSKISNVFTKKQMSEPITEDGFTPLMVAVKHGRAEFVRRLLQDRYCNATILEKISSDFERTVLHICAEFLDKSITDDLLEKANLWRIDLAPTDVMGDTPLHICAQKNNFYMCNKLLSICENSPGSGSNSRHSSNGRTTNPIDMLRILNNNGLTAFHVATENGYYEIVKRMIAAVSNPKTLIEELDAQLRTSLHMAALKGNAEIVQLFITRSADVDACNINDHTPLHEAARWSDSADEENQHRIKCIDELINAGADVNALNIHRESPLHIACRYGSSSLVKCLLKHDADLLQTNIQGFNCLEVAIEEKNEETVKHLIEHDYIFELMRNAQLYESRREPCCTCGSQTYREQCCIPCCKCIDKCSFYTWRMGLDRRIADTPMRKLIISMPDMALEILEKCTTTIGSEKSKIHRKFFDYEFLEDQYVIRDWLKGNLNNNSVILGKAHVKYDAIRKDEPYTIDYKTLVMNHPLFLMAVYDRYKLMAHPLSQSLVDHKFYGISLILFMLGFGLFATFLSIYTTIVLRTQHPQYYYNLTGYDFDGSLCRNVTQALVQSNTGLKGTADNILKIVMYVFFGLLVLKNLWAIIGYIRVSPSKIFTFILEIIALGFSFYFIFDSDYQQKVTMRCPIQWQLGACGLFIGYIALFYYIQYIPIFGIYVIMMRQILIRFLLFLPVLFVLICAFALSLYMIFQNFNGFTDMGVSLAKTVIMMTGEINYDDLMHNDTTTAYYKVGFFLLISLAITMTILVSNLLIGLAVGEIGPMMATAKDTRLDMLYELAADFEILKLQLVSNFNRCCHFCFIRPQHYKQSDLTKQWIWFKNLKKRLLVSCAREVDDDDLSEASEDDDTNYPTHILEEVRKGIHQLHNTRPSTGSSKTGPLKAITGTKSTNKK